VANFNIDVWWVLGVELEGLEELEATGGFALGGLPRGLLTGMTGGNVGSLGIGGAGNISSLVPRSPEESTVWSESAQGVGRDKLDVPLGGDRGFGVGGVLGITREATGVIRGAGSCDWEGASSESEAMLKVLSLCAVLRRGAGCCLAFPLFSILVFTGEEGAGRGRRILSSTKREWR